MVRFHWNVIMIRCHFASTPISGRRSYRGYSASHRLAETGYNDFPDLSSYLLKSPAASVLVTVDRPALRRVGLHKPLEGLRTDVLQDFGFDLIRFPCLHADDRLFHAIGIAMSRLFVRVLLGVGFSDFFFASFFASSSFFCR